MFQQTIRNLGTWAFAFIATATIPSLAAASVTEIEMVQVASTYPAGYHGKITAMVDDTGAGITEFTFTESGGAAKKFTTEDLRKGIVLVHQMGKDIIKLSASDFTREAGGTMHLSFLRGFFGSDRRQVAFEYIRNGGATDWMLQTNDAEGREPFDAISIVINKSLGIPSSVGTITLKGKGRTVRTYNPYNLPPGMLMLEDFWTL